MTPFGEKVRQYREEKHITQKQMAKMLSVSSAYLSTLENGKKGLPSYQIVHRICGLLNIIWDDADDLMRLARLSHPKVTVNTVALSPLATEVANLLAENISNLSHEELQQVHSLIKKK